MKMASSRSVGIFIAKAEFGLAAIVIHEVLTGDQSAWWLILAALLLLASTLIDLIADDRLPGPHGSLRREQIRADLWAHSAKQWREMYFAELRNKDRPS